MTKSVKRALIFFIHSNGDERWERYFLSFNNRQYCAQIQLNSRQPNGFVAFFRGSLLDIKIKQILNDQPLDLNSVTMDDCVTFTAYGWPSDKKLTKFLEKYESVAGCD